MFDCVFVTLLCGVLGHVWYLIVLIPDLCSILTLMYIVSMSLKIVFIFITKSADPDEILFLVAFYHGLHCLPKYLFFLVFRIKRV